MVKLQILEKISTTLNNWSKIFLCFFMVIMVVDVLFGVLNRFLLKFSISWTEEVARYLMIWITMLGSCIAMKSGAHIGVTFMLDKLGKTKNPTIILSNLLIIFFLGIATWYGIELCISQAYQMSPALRISMSYPYASIPACSIIMIVHLIVLTRQMIKHSQPD